MTDTPTPRTDATRNYKADVVARNARLIDLSEQLERELAEANTLLEKFFDAYPHGRLGDEYRAMLAAAIRTS